MCHATVSTGTPVHAFGLFLWHNQGAHFGLGKAGGKVNPIVAYVCLALLLMIVAVEVAVGDE